MEEPLPEELTRWLGRAADGERAAWSRVLPLLYAELRTLAANQLQRNDGRLTVPPTAIVHEAWEKIAAREGAQWNDRQHFVSVMALAMRGLLIDHARRRGALKRGGAEERLTLSAVDERGAELRLDLLDLDQALHALEDEYPRPAQVVLLRFFGGFSVEEVAAHLGLSITTVEADWRLARAWLKRRLEN